MHPEQRRGSGIDFAQVVKKKTCQKQNALYRLRPVNTPAVEGCTIRWTVYGRKQTFRVTAR